MTDYLDGSNSDAFVTFDDRVIIYPGYRASVGALTRLTDHLAERFAAREVADVAASTPPTRDELFTTGSNLTPAVDLAECVDRLLHGFTTYDRAVDVVSAFETAFTTRISLPGTVRHFERFPRIPGDRGSTLTPDFTVVFHDGTGLAVRSRVSRCMRTARRSCVARFQSTTSCDSFPHKRSL